MLICLKLWPSSAGFPHRFVCFQMVSFTWRLLPSRIKIKLFMSCLFRILFHKKYLIKITIKFFPKVENWTTTKKDCRIFKIQWEAYKDLDIYSPQIDIFVYTNKCFLVLLQNSSWVFQLSGCCTAGQVNVQQWPKPTSGWGWAKKPWHDWLVGQIHE